VTAWLGLAFLLMQAPTGTDGDRARAEKLHNDGYQLFLQGKPDEGRDAVLASLAAHEQLGDKPLQAINLRMLALIHDGTGDRQQALAYYDRALRLMRETRNRTGEASTLRDIGVLYYNLDENARAFQYLDQALALQRPGATPGVLAATLFSLGEMHRYLANPARAKPLLTEALALAKQAGIKKTQADALGSLAMLDVRAGELKTASLALEEAIRLRGELDDPRGEASTRLRRGFYHQANKEPLAAAEDFSEAARLFEIAKYKGGEAFARQALALLERDRGNWGVAHDEMLRAVELAEGLRERLSDRDLRATYIGYVQNRYEFLIDALLALDGDDPRRAFAMSERARARALVETLQDSGVSGVDTTPTLTLEEVQKRVLDDSTTLVEYALGGKQSHLFVVTKNSIVHHRLPPRSILETAARKAYETYREPGQRPSAAELAKLFLPGVRAKRLLIVADGALQYLPFVDFAPADAVVVAPSASAIAALRALPSRRIAGKKLAVFADPSAPQFARLPFARMESENILRLVPADQRVAAMGADATREAVLRNPASIVHFAAHSILDTERPERTELVLSGSSLRLRDISKLRVPASLVVLSACQTALGKEMKREGLLGLASAFQQGGTPRIVASLWKVDDRATAELMKGFYTAMLRDGKPAAAALREAQRSVAATSRWSHPYYWAGFVLQGEWR